MKTVTVCADSGFCFGVRRAADMLQGLLAEGKKVCTLGALVHNNAYLEQLGKQGVRIVNDVSEVAPGECLLIRSHGVPPSTVKKIEDSGVEWHDATCPSVSKIHRIAASVDADGVLLVAGDPHHPETVGILGCATCPCYTFGSAQELEKLLAGHECFSSKQVSMLAQTTFSLSEWKKCCEITEKHCTNPKIFATICNTTRLRQTEAEKLAAVCDLMIVIGSGESSNTGKLYEICAAKTHTVRIESADELDMAQVAGHSRIGITAGASTPVNNIMEVVHIMDEKKDILPGTPETEPTQEEEFNFETELEESYKRLSKADTIKGIVIGISPGEVAVDIGRKHAAYIPLAELTDDPNAKTSDLVKMGDELTLMVLKTNDVDGTVMMSKKRVDASANWAAVVAAKDSGEVLEGIVVENVRGGVIVAHEGTRVFIPASHTGVPKDGDLDTLLKQTVKFVIIDIDDRGRHKRAVGSIRKASSASRKEAVDKFWETAKVGDVIVGKVRSIAAFGVFVNVGGPDGLVHQSELSWERYKKIEDVVTVGQDIKVIIKELDPEKRRISLTAKMPEDDPFNVFLTKYSTGDVITATITSIMTYGAFATVMPGVEGLIHISNISHDRDAKINELLQKGKQVDVKIIEINPERKKISLSIKALTELPEDNSAPSQDATVATFDDPAPEAAPEAAPETAPEE